MPSFLVAVIKRIKKKRKKKSEEYNMVTAPICLTLYGHARSSFND